LGHLQFGKDSNTHFTKTDTASRGIELNRVSPIISSSGVTYGINTLTIDRPSFTTVTAGKGVRLRELPSGDVIAEIDSVEVFRTEDFVHGPEGGFTGSSATMVTPTIRIMYDDGGSDITMNLDSLKFARDIQLPQAWQDSTVWDAPYDPNLFFHKSHEWVYSEFDDLNQDYQKQFPYPLGGMEYQGRICKVCKTKQQRTIYYGTGKNPFKKIPTNSPYSQLLLQSRQ